MENDISKLIKGAVLGHIVGDALGNPYRNLNENMPDLIDMVGDSEGLPPGTYSSASAMLLCAMASINEMGELNANDLMERFYEMYIGGYLAASEDSISLDEITSQAIKNHSNGMPFDKCGIFYEMNDNEPLARTLPISLFYCMDSIDVLIEKSHLNCTLTHKNIRAQVCCALYSLVIKNLILAQKEKIFDLLADFYKTKNMNDYLKELLYIKDNRTNNGTNEIVDSFWSTWDCYAKYDGEYSLATVDAVKMGNNSNITSAIVGALCGACSGIDDIPQHWLNKITLFGEALDTAQTFTLTVMDKIK